MLKISQERKHKKLKGIKLSPLQSKIAYEIQNLRYMVKHLIE